MKEKKDELTYEMIKVLNTLDHILEIAKKQLSERDIKRLEEFVDEFYDFYDDLVFG